MKKGISLIEMLLALSIISIISISYFKIINIATESSIKKTMYSDMKMLIEKQRMYYKKYGRFFNIDTKNNIKEESVKNIIFDEFTEIETKEFLCEEERIGFLISIYNKKIKEKEIYYSCTDNSFKDKYKIIKNEEIELISSNEFEINEKKLFNREFDGINLNYEQAEEYCEKIGGRIPTIEEIEAGYMKDQEGIKMIYLENENYWTKSNIIYELKESLKKEIVNTKEIRLNVKCIK